ncbi:hypothetical protein [Paenibacillus periandrae]|uniref:hypothetical protein n=1 Tax=Paenibacillus periandrae TaxID=1761741 RepID=UPI001F090270|nr:hypothetical protein [Paenibacillus periandrae]
MSESANLSPVDRNDVTYTISTQNVTYQNDAIEASLITDIIEGFAADPDDFIILDPSAPVGESSYIQACPAQDALNSIIVELRLNYADQSFKHYSYQTPDKGQVIRMFLNYWGLQKLPDWTHWTDITDQF